jgi:hypothetical protein
LTVSNKLLAGLRLFLRLPTGAFNIFSSSIHTNFHQQGANELLGRVCHPNQKQQGSSFFLAIKVDSAKLFDEIVFRGTSCVHL